MRTEIIKHGWDEVTTVKVRYDGFIRYWRKVEWLVDFLKRYPNMNTHGRKGCQCCHKTWDKFSADTDTYFITTTKGNKIICRGCAESMELPITEEKFNP